MSISKDDKRIVIETGMVGDELCAAISGRQIRVEISEPWAGDTETGFGETASTYLSPEEAIELGEWLVSAGRAALRERE
ncbi:hypothetical protein [Brucella intermedia]|uniref:hypothetical protein n=1 Tax=Brucella intermedia TaxID=94625 RepID=UPI002448EEEE|nr:hypothetical protein [Brucella intermedia]WGG61893.1 hypothetical protein QA414_15350 [Brucella intermedia]